MDLSLLLMYDVDLKNLLSIVLIWLSWKLTLLKIAIVRCGDIENIRRHTQIFSLIIYLLIFIVKKELSYNVILSGAMEDIKMCQVITWI